MPIGEMTVTLDDVTYLLHIPIEGKMMGHEEQTSYEKGVELMTWKQWGGYVGIPFLKRLYEGRLSKAIQLDDVDGDEEEKDNKQD